MMMSNNTAAAIILGYTLIVFAVGVLLGWIAS